MTGPRVLVVGRSGQVAQALMRVASERGTELVALGRPELDLTQTATVGAALDRHAPHLVINTAAYTAVDTAQAESDAADALNHRGPHVIAVETAARGLPLIHLSTDCVFDGTKPTPYLADDAPHPINVYGQTKWDGERAVAQANPRYLVVRVCWIFSDLASNFVKTMLRLAETRDEVSVVSDQIGCPTHAPALAGALLDIAACASQPGFDAWGTYHLGGTGETDRASMARTIFEESAHLGGPVSLVRGVLTADYPTPARRPLNARLDMATTRAVFGVDLPDWQHGLATTIQNLNGNRAR